MRQLQEEPEELEGLFNDLLISHQWNFRQIHELLEEMLPRQGEIHDFRIERNFPDIGPRKFLLNARRFYEESRGIQFVMMVLELLEGERSALPSPNSDS